MGTPSATEPWGWQLDGHHLVINYFVLRDQVVMTPTFMGSEPVIAASGQVQGHGGAAGRAEQGLALMTRLTARAAQTGDHRSAKTANNTVTQAFRDNVVLDYAGIKAVRPGRQAAASLLVDVIAEYVSNMRCGPRESADGRSPQPLDRHLFRLDWRGRPPTSVFYYRIQSPVILIEFDHQLPVGLQGLPRVPNRKHIHTVVRTPNGNDYGKDLLRQHHVSQNH